MTVEMRFGIVKFFKPTEGYGFIRPSDEGREVFFHIKQGCRIRPCRSEEGIQFEKGASRIPVDGDRLAFTDIPGRNGKSPQAERWIFEDEWYAGDTLKDHQLSGTCPICKSHQVEVRSIIADDQNLEVVDDSREDKGFKPEQFVLGDHYDRLHNRDCSGSGKTPEKVVLEEDDQDYDMDDSRRPFSILGEEEY